MAIVKLSDALRSFVATHSLSEKISEGEVLLRWPEVVGEKIASVTEVLRCEAGELTVRVSSSVWRKELHMCSKEVLAKIDAAFPGIVKKIVWR